MNFRMDLRYVIKNNSNYIFYKAIFLLKLLFNVTIIESYQDFYSFLEYINNTFLEKASEI